jgi:hypothetical protein
VLISTRHLPYGDITDSCQPDETLFRRGGATVSAL